MSSDALLAELQDIFRDVFDVPDLLITRESNAEMIENWDSLTHVTLMTAISKRYKVKFALGELQSLKKVGDLEDLLQSKLQPR